MVEVMRAVENKTLRKRKTRRVTAVSGSELSVERKKESKGMPLAKKVNSKKRVVDVI
jgi:hypothetical protein